MKKIELSSADNANCTAEPGDALVSGSVANADGGSGSDEGECDELRADPAVVDLPVDASVTTSFVSTVPAGTYKAFEAKIHVVNGTDPLSTAFLTANPSFAGVSAHVEGTYNGTAFTYDGHARAKLELAFDPAVTVLTSGINITVNVDLGTWFVDGTGALVDPTTANTGGANEMLVNHNIHESFEAFEDDDHDGHEDHH